MPFDFIQVETGRCGVCLIVVSTTRVAMAWSASWIIRSVTLSRALRGPTADLVSSVTVLDSLSRSWSMIREWFVWCAACCRVLLSARYPAKNIDKENLPRS